MKKYQERFLSTSTLLQTGGSLLGLVAPALLLAGCAMEPEEARPSEPETPGEVGPDDAAVAPFVPESARNFIVSENGETIGYFDAQLRERDLEGKLVTPPSATALSFFPRPHRVIVYTDANFKGFSTSWHGDPSFAINLDGNTNNRVSSVVVAPGCKVDLYDGANQTGALLISINPTRGRAVYINLRGSNDKASSLRVSCTATAPNSLCGYLYSNVNYSGDVLPIYNDHRYSLHTGFTGWDNTVSSVAANPYATCDGIGLWQHPADTASIDVNQKRILLLNKASSADLHARGMGDQITYVEADRELSVGEAHHSGLGRLLRAVQEKRSWGKAFTCDLMKSLCVDYKTVIQGMTSVAGFFTCAKLIGTGAVTALAAAGTEVGSGGAATPIAAGLAGYSAREIALGIGCLAATGLAVVVEGSLCSATMETYCNTYAR